MNGLTAMETDENTRHYQFTLDLLKALHLNEDSFFDDLANGAPYEVQIYKWINKLFKQRKSVEEAIALIHRVRRLFIL